MKTTSRQLKKAAGKFSPKQNHWDYFHIIHRYVMFSYLIYWAGFSGMTSQLMR
jgi:hypothetical protein